jgi:propanediol utilization protein
VHLNSETALNENLEDNEIVEIFYNNEYIFDAEIKITEDAYNELHIDTFEEIRYDLSSGKEVEIKKCGK